MYNPSFSLDLISTSPPPWRNSGIHYKDVSAAILGVDGKRDAHRLLLRIMFHMLA
jgi:hypothetical protein